MRKLLFIFFMSSIGLMAQDTITSPQIFPTGPCMVLPQNPKSWSISVAAGPSFLVDKPSQTVNSTACFSFNPSRKSRLSYSLDWDYKPSSIHSIGQSGISVLYDFLKSERNTLAGGLSIHILWQKLNWGNCLFPDQLLISDTVITSMDLRMANGTTNRTSTFHGHLIFTSPHWFIIARFLDLTTPNTGFVSYSEYSEGIQLNSGYMNQTKNGFRTIAGGWKKNYAGSHIFHVEALYQFHKAGFGAQILTNKSAGIRLMFLNGKTAMGFSIFSGVQPANKAIKITQTQLLFTFNLL